MHNLVCKLTVMRFMSLLGPKLPRSCSSESLYLQQFVHISPAVEEMTCRRRESCYSDKDGIVGR